jgi:hypothetical protein
VACSVKITPEDALIVVRAFSEMLNLINAAEVHHTIRVLRKNEMQFGTVEELTAAKRVDSVGGTIRDILKNAEAQGKDIPTTKSQIMGYLKKQKVRMSLCTASYVAFYCIAIVLYCIAIALYCIAM